MNLGFNRLVVPMFFAVCACVAPTAAAQQPNVSLTAFACSGELNISPKVFVMSGFYGSGAETSAIAQEMAPGVFSLTLAMQPGHYFFEVRTTNCFGVAGTEILPGRIRHLAFQLADNTVHDVHSNCSLAGTLPAAGIGVELMNVRKPVSYRAVVDDGAYYAEGIGPGTYHLVLLLAGADIDLGVVNLDAINGKCEAHIVRDVSLDEVRAHSTQFFGIQTPTP